MNTATHNFGQFKPGDIVEFVQYATGANIRVQLTKPPTLERGRWRCPGYRWIKSRGVFSGSALEHLSAHGLIERA